MININSLFDLTGKTAVITGGTGVLGSQMVLALAAAGANTVIIGLKKEAGDPIVEELAAQGRRCLNIQANVLDVGQMEQSRKQILDEFGTIDILVNAAGGNMAGAVISPDQTFFDLNLTEFGKVVDLNLTGTVLPTKILGEVIAKKGNGVIINIASMASFRPITRVVGYAASKSAVKNFTEWMAIELAKKFGEGVRVNAIAPGFFLTEQNRTLLSNPDGSYTQRGQEVLKNTPFGRFGRPDELAGTLVWLCSDASRFVTGVTVPVDGGFNVFCGV